MDLNKKFKKRNFIIEDWVYENIDRLNEKIIFEKFLKEEYDECLTNPCEQCNKNDEEKKKMKTNETTLILKNSIDRLIGKTTTGLYSIKETFYKEDYKKVIYAKYDKSKINLEKIKNVFEFIGIRGYGKDKNVGKGKFEVDRIDTNFNGKEYFDENIAKEKGRIFYLNLSNMFKDSALEIYYGKKFTKFPKAGGNLAYYHPFKNPIILFQAGSTFRIKEGNIKNLKSFYGSAKEEVFNKKGFYHSGYSLGIYFGVEYETF
jgi:CRISPR-associated protein Csm4